MSKETVTIKKDRLPILRDKLAKLNRKCVKLGCPEMILTVDPNESIWHQVEDFFGQFTTIVAHENLDKYRHAKITSTWVEIDVTLDYEIPIIDGWELISTFDIVPKLTKDEKGETIYGDPIVFTSTVPDKTLPARFLDKNEIHCDHCGHKRYRTHSMLMHEIETDLYKEVGSTCIKDFFGHDPKNLLWMAQISLTTLIDEIEDDFGSGGHGMFCHDLDQLLSYTALAIRLNGWISKGAAYEDPSLIPTAEMMNFYLYPPKSVSTSDRQEPIAEDIELAKLTRIHFETLDAGDNDYLTNCKKVVELGYVPVKQEGVACSMVATYRNHIREKMEKKDTPESSFVGEIGEKIEVENVKVVWLTECQSDWGVSVLYIFVDEKTGNKFKTFYSGKTWSAMQGDIVNLKGTVKKHDEYKGSKDTMLSRCNVKIIKTNENA